jgi:hypothetical protein
LVLCVCGGGVLAHGPGHWGGMRAGEAKTALGTYLDKVKSGDDTGAYRQLCSDVLFDYSEQDHAGYLASQPKITAYTIGDPLGDQGLGSTYLEFPVRLTYADGHPATVRFETKNDRGGVTICDGRGWRT